MFYVNLPYHAEWFFSSGDLKMLENTFRGKLMGAKKGAFSDEDMEAFKYTYNSMCKLLYMNLCRLYLQWIKLKLNFKYLSH